MNEKKESLTTSIQFNCGCGFRSPSVIKSNDHVNNTGHTVTISGVVYLTTNKPSILLPQDSEHSTSAVQ